MLGLGQRLLPPDVTSTSASSGCWKPAMRVPSYGGYHFFFHPMADRQPEFPKCWLVTHHVQSPITNPLVGWLVGWSLSSPTTVVWDEALAQAIRRGKGSKVPIAEQVEGSHRAISTGAQHGVAWRSELAWKAGLSTSAAN